MEANSRVGLTARMQTQTGRRGTLERKCELSHALVRRPSGATSQTAGMLHRFGYRYCDIVQLRKRSGLRAQLVIWRSSASA